MMTLAFTSKSGVQCKNYSTLCGPTIFKNPKATEQMVRIVSISLLLLTIKKIKSRESQVWHLCLESVTVNFQYEVQKACRSERCGQINYLVHS